MPPNHDHHGKVANALCSMASVPFWMSVAAIRQSVPTKKDTNDATSGDITDCRKREFALVCTGVSAPRMKIISK